MKRKFPREFRASFEVLTWRLNNLRQQQSCCQLLTIKSDYSFISVKYLQHHTRSMGHSGQVGGSLQQGCYPPTSWLQPQLILPLQSFLPSFLPCIPTTREKSTSTHPSLVLTCCRFVFKVAIRGSFPAYRALTTKQDICTVWEWAVCPQTHRAKPASHGRR